jgi:predicted GH43/DUF377 family glycosyl hydrolase
LKKSNIIKSIILCQPILIAMFVFSCSKQPSGESLPDWALGPFIKQDAVNPILLPKDDTEFLCPVRNEKVRWEEKDVFNPSALVRNGKIHLLYRAEDTIGKLLGTSRIGLAISDDGLQFTRRSEPVLYPDNDDFYDIEWEGGCEDPRIVENEESIYYMNYTAWNGDKARLCVASSRDLLHWQKHGSVFQKAYDGKYANIWSKSGSVVCRLENDRFISTRIEDKYWMYFGESDIYLAHSEDLVNWTPVETDERQLKPVFSPRKGKFDSELVEPGPPALITRHGIVLIYNSKNSPEYGDPDLPAGTYAAGQILMATDDPGKVLDRLKNYFFKPEKSYEITGQVNNVCFVEGLVQFHDQWFLYYGTADSKIAVATCQNNNLK